MIRQSSLSKIFKSSNRKALLSTATINPPTTSIYTHDVFNQSKPLENVNLLKSDKIIQESITKMISTTKNENNFHVDWKYIEDCGIKAGSAELIEAGSLAEKNVPTLRQFDNYGRRIDVVEYHPSYHQIMSHGAEHGVCAYGFKNAKSGSQITRGILTYFENQIDPGHGCPLTMTAAVLPVLLRALHAAKKNPSSNPTVQDNLKWVQHFIDKIYAQKYDHRDLPIEKKNGVTMGMSMTEKQGGSDVRSNTTAATPIDSQVTGMGAAYTLVGHKWFTSAPMCDGFLTLAKTPGSDVPSCFLVPRWLPESSGGHRNQGFQVMRLKNKVADRANASSEVEYRNAYGVMIGDEGKGVKTIIEMVQATRWDCTLGSASTGRRALQIAVNHATGRSAFGKVLIDQPLMQNVLTDLAIESEASTLLAMRMSAAYDAYYNGNPSIVNCSSLEEAQELFRIGVTISKYYVTKRLPHLTYECMECIGGNSFHEDWPIAKLFRHSPLNSIWEGSGNVIALDVLRGMKSIPILLKEIALAKGLSTHFDAFYQKLEKELYKMNKDLAANPKQLEYYQRGARYLADSLAIAFEASLLLRFSHPSVAEGYLQSRIGTGEVVGRFANNYGGTAIYDEKLSRAVLDRNLPVFY